MVKNVAIETDGVLNMPVHCLAAGCAHEIQLVPARKMAECSFHLDQVALIPWAWHAKLAQFVPVRLFLKIIFIRALISG